MKKTMIIMILVVSFSCFANPILWEIKGDNPSYLFGTIHYPDPRVTPLPETVTGKLDNVKAFVMEAVIDETAMGVIIKYVMLDSLTLEEIMPETLYKQCDSLLGMMGQSMQMYNTMKPWMLTLTFSTPPPTDSLPGIPMDLFLMNEAQERNLDVLGLETIEDQIKLFDEQTLEDQIKSLEKTVNDYDNYHEKLDEIIDIYAKGDVEKLHDAVNFGSTTKEDIEFIKKILYKRNNTMHEGIIKLLESGESHFIAVGAGHLGGEKGLLKKLKDSGYKLKRVK